MVSGTTLPPSDLNRCPVVGMKEAQSHPGSLGTGSSSNISTVRGGRQCIGLNWKSRDCSPGMASAFILTSCPEDSGKPNTVCKVKGSSPLNSGWLPFLKPLHGSDLPTASSPSQRFFRIHVTHLVWDSVFPFHFSGYIIPDNTLLACQEKGKK